MNSRSVARELAFLAISQITRSTELNSDSLILSSTRTLRDIARKQLKKVQSDLEELGSFFFNESLKEKEENSVPVSMKTLYENVAKLELATFSLKESLDLPELLNHDSTAMNYAIELVNSFRQNKEEISKLIAELLQKRKEQKGKGWNLDRVLSTDRDIMKIATTEILYLNRQNNNCPEVVVVNEAVKLASKYGTEDSAKFVNGVLADLMSSRNLQSAVEPEIG